MKEPGGGGTVRATNICVIMWNKKTYKWIHMDAIYYKG